MAYASHMQLLQAYAKSSEAPAALRTLIDAQLRAGPPPVKTDKDLLIAQHEFIRDDAADAALAIDLARRLEGSAGSSKSKGAGSVADPDLVAERAARELKLARAYWQKLYKEYAIVDLSRYKEGKVGMRWRTERETIAGKGQFVCAALGCDAVISLHSYEVPFRYQEKGESKTALVKVRLCGPCATKMFYQQVNKEAPSSGRGGAAAAASATSSGARTAASASTDGPPKSIARASSLRSRSASPDADSDRRRSEWRDPVDKKRGRRRKRSESSSSRDSNSNSSRDEGTRSTSARARGSERSKSSGGRGRGGEG